MLTLAVAWGLFFLSQAVLLNSFTLVVFLNSWRLYSGDGSAATTSLRARRDERPEKMGYFLFVFILFCNLVFLVSNLRDNVRICVVRGACLLENVQISEFTAVAYLGGVSEVRPAPGEGKHHRRTKQKKQARKKRAIKRNRRGC